MNNMDKARLIVERLNAKGAELGNASWGIVGQVLDEIDAANDPYMPTPEEWAAHPWAKFAATDKDGEILLYTDRPTDAQTTIFWRCENCTGVLSLKYVAPPADFHDTLRHRPEGI